MAASKSHAEGAGGAWSAPHPQAAQKVLGGHEWEEALQLVLGERLAPTVWVGVAGVVGGVALLTLARGPVAAPRKLQAKE